MTKPHRERFTFLRGMLLFYLLLLVIFFATTPFLAMMLYWETDFSRSMLPVLIGFCLQGMFIVLVFAVYQYDSTMKSRQNNKLLLRSMLSPMIRVTLAQGGEANLQANKEALPAPGRLLEAKERILQQAVEPQNEEKLRRIFSRTAFALESMTSVAVQIDTQHMEAWQGIITALQNFEDATNEEERQAAIVELLERVQWFDEMPL